MNAFENGERFREFRLQRPGRRGYNEKGKKLSHPISKETVMIVLPFRGGIDSVIADEFGHRIAGTV